MKTSTNHGGCDLTAEEHGNCHHNIPQSRCGSNNPNNLSTVPITRHNHFHQRWGSNALPTELIRHVALQSIGLVRPEHRMDASQLRQLFEMTRNQEWEQYYWSDALSSMTNVQAPVRALQNLRTTMNFLDQEKVWARETVAVIRGEETTFPADNHLLLDNSMEFFDVRTPAKALESFLTEEHHGELSWCKPLKYNVRAKLLEVLQNPGGTPSHNRKEYVHVLLEHHKSLDLHTRDIERTIRHLHDDLRKFMYMSILRPDDREGA